MQITAQSFIENGVHRPNNKDGKSKHENRTTVFTVIKGERSTWKNGYQTKRT